MKKYFAMAALVALAATSANGQLYNNATDVAIPDNPPVSSSIVIAGFVGTITDVNVCMALNHTFDGDLDIVLAGPGGLVQHLTSDNGSGGDNYGNFTTGTYFDDEGAPAITAGAAPFAGRFSPEITAQAMTAPAPAATAGSLSRWDGGSANGTWTLWIDDDAGGDVGTLRHWSLIFNDTGSPGTVTDPACNLSVPPPPATHLGSVTPTSGMLMAMAPLAAAQVQWYTFTTTGTIATPNWLVADTLGSSLTGGTFPNDTEIGLYDSTGALLVNNDDINFLGDGSGTYTSRVTAGGTPPPQVPPGGTAGPASLAAGTYYVAVGGFNTTFGATGWNVTSTSTLTGTTKVTITTPEPSTLALLAVSALALVRRRR